MILLLAIFYLGLTAAGMLILRIAGLDALHGWKKVAAAFCVGQGCYTLLLWMGGGLGLFRVVAWVIPLSALTVWLCLGALRLRAKGAWPLVRKHHFAQCVSWCCVAVLALFLFQHYSGMTLRAPIEGVPGMGNWGYKAKIIFLNEGVPDNYMSDYSTVYGKFSYPIGFPMMSAALYTMAGHVDEALAKANAILLFVATYVVISLGFIERWRNFGFVPVIGLFGFFLGTPAWQVIDGFYSEPLLFFCSSTALICLFERDQYPLAIVCAGCAAWVKQEGILFYGLLAISVCLLHWKNPWKDLSWSIVTGGLFVLAWQVYVRLEHVSDSDFDFGGSWDPAKVFDALKKLRDVGIINFRNYSGAFLCLPFMLAFALWDRNAESLICGLIAALMLIIFAGVMGYSRIHLEWHLDAVERYLMLPAICIFMGFSVMLRQPISTTPAK